jgi:hypothetical protein
VRAPDSAVGMSTAYGLERPESNPGEGEILRTRPDRPWGPPNILYNGYRASLTGVKRPSGDGNHPAPSNFEIKERVELYLYPSPGP